MVTTLDSRDNVVGIAVSCFELLAYVMLCYGKIIWYMAYYILDKKKKKVEWPTWGTHEF